MPFHPASSLARLLDAPMRPGRVVWLGLRPERRGVVQAISRATLHSRQGVEGDHYTRLNGRRQVTLMQAEALRSIASHLGRDTVAPEDFRRNIVTEGINLSALKERRFRLGADVVLETSGECHPCSRMEEILGEGGYNAVRGLGGVTAMVIEGGVVALGDLVAPIPESAPFYRDPEEP